MTDQAEQFSRSLEARKDDPQFPAYCKWMAGQGYIDRGEYAKGRVVLTREGFNHLKRVRETDRQIREMIYYGLLVGSEYRTNGRIVPTQDAIEKGYFDKHGLERGAVSLTREGMEHLEGKFLEDVQAYSRGAAEEAADQILRDVVIMTHMKGESEQQRRLTAEAFDRGGPRLFKVVKVEEVKA